MGDGNIFADKVAKLCFDNFKSLGNSGKPVKGKEWTLLSGIVAKFNKNNDEYDLKVLSLATGSKCIGRNFMSPDGTVVNDSHAEVLARRCFLRYLYHQIELIKCGKESDVLIKKTDKIISSESITIKQTLTRAFNSSGEKISSNDCDNIFNQDKFTVKSGVTFHLFSSHVPCGDASIIPMSNSKDSLVSDVKDVSDINILPVIDGEQISSSCESGSNVKSLACVNKRKSKFGDTDDGNVVNKKIKDYRESFLCDFVENNYNNSFFPNNVDNNFRNDEIADKSTNSVVIKSSTINKISQCGDVLLCGIDNSKSGCLNAELIDLSDTVGRIIGGFDDIYRTGAKCIPEDPRQDPKNGGINYHIVGVVRTKPGRGDPTLSVSCSDKIARWMAVGIQGALLSLLVEPIFFSTIIIGAGGPFSKKSLYRAIIGRTKTRQPVQFFQSQHVFEMSKYSPDNENGKRPCPAAIMWTNIHDRQLEVAIQGRRLGTTKKSKNKGSLFICKKNLFKLFIKLTDRKFLNKTYWEVKQLSKTYQDGWKNFRNKFGAWSNKPSSLMNFFIDESDL